jgi:hypothetical protein
MHYQAAGRRLHSNLPKGAVLHTLAMYDEAERIDHNMALAAFDLFRRGRKGMSKCPKGGSETQLLEAM